MILTDKQAKYQRKRVKFLFNWYIDRLRLRWWSFVFEYDRGESREDINSQWKFRRFASVWSSWKYCDAMIKVYLGEIAELSDDVLEETVLHELMHVYINETRREETDIALEHEERVVTSLARSFISFRISQQVPNPLVAWKKEQKKGKKKTQKTPSNPVEE